MIRLACLGECMVELSDLADQSRPGLMQRGFGGDTLNTAVYMARCLEGQPDARVQYVTALGDDPLSAEMIAAWQDEGLDTGLVRRLEGYRPGLYMIRTDASGERSFVYWRSAAAAREVMRAWSRAALRERLGDCDLLYFSGISLGILDDCSRGELLALAGSLRQHGCAVAFDSNYRPALWGSSEVARDWMAKAYRVASVALPSLADEQALFGDDDAEVTAARLHSLGVEEIVVKNGAEACLVSGEGGQNWVTPALLGTPRDTTAAGDSFNAAYLAARALGKPPLEAARVGCDLAARVIQAPGAIVARAVFPGSKSGRGA